jgi:PAT family acetyl-CoA transporter-like MFS transporter 1
VGYASTCNTIGQSLGYFMANQGLIALSDETWCNRFLGTPKGYQLVSLAEFLQFWGVVFVVITIGIWVMKKEAPLPLDEQPESVAQTYGHIRSIFKLQPIMTLTITLLTCKAAFSPIDAAATFKLQEYGMPKADIATFSPVLLVVGLLLPALVGHYVTRDPVRIFIGSIALKLCTCILNWAVFQYAVVEYSQHSVPGSTFYASLVTAQVLHEGAGILVYVSIMSFFSQIADPAIGGTYMTLLNTLANLGSKWPNSLVLYLLPRLTQASCLDASTGESLALDCASSRTSCTEAGGECNVQLDGFTVATLGGCVLGVVWLVLMRSRVLRLVHVPPEDWIVVSRSEKSS